MTAASDEAVAPLLAVWRDAAVFLDREQRRIRREVAGEAQEWRRGRLRLQQRRVEALAERVDAAMAALRSTSAGWLEVGLPGVYEQAAREAADDLGQDWNWTMPHAAAVEFMARDTWQDVLAATRFVEADTRRFIRDTAAREGRRMTTTGQTVRHAARNTTREARARGIAAVQYRDGSYRGIADYSDMLLRTKAAHAYTSGTINVAREAGVTYVMLSDGPGCGLAHHHDLLAANGLVVPIETAMDYPTAHPRCRRVVIPRPDLNEGSTLPEMPPPAPGRNRGAAYVDQFDAQTRRIVQR